MCSSDVVTKSAVFLSQVGFTREEIALVWLAFVQLAIVWFTRVRLAIVLSPSVGSVTSLLEFLHGHLLDSRKGTM